MRLQGDDDEILRTEFGGIVGAAWMDHAFFIPDQKLQSAGLHRGEMSAARNQAHISASARELDPEITADGAGAVNADFHQAFLENVDAGKRAQGDFRLRTNSEPQMRLDGTGRGVRP